MKVSEKSLTVSLHIFVTQHYIDMCIHMHADFYMNSMYSCATNTFTLTKFQLGF